jgi:class 3 adenylate cyclase
VNAEAELRSLGLGVDDAAQLATLVALPPEGTLDETDSSPTTTGQVALHAALLAVRQTSRFAGALRILLGVLEQEELAPFDEGRFLHVRGLAAWRLDSLPFHATRALNRSLLILGGLAEPRAQRYLARVHDTLGQVLHQQGMTSDALRELQRSLELRDPADRFGAAITRGNLGRLYIELGNYPAAATELALDLATIEDIAPTLVVVRSQLMSHLAHCHLEMGLVEEAERFYTTSVALADEAGDAAAASFGRVGLGRVAVARADAPTALTVASSIFASLDSATMFENTRAMLRVAVHLLTADAHLHAKQYEKAIEDFQAALQQLAKTTSVSPMEYARAYRGLASALAAKEEHAESARSLRLALRHLDGTAAEASRLEVERDLQAASRDSWLLHAAGRFLGHQQIEVVLGEAGRIGFRGSRRRTAVLFSDIRGFTTLAEKLDPEELVGMLNDFLSQMTRCIDSHGGTVDKFIGDAVMAVFPLDDKGSGAIEAGVAMQDELERFNRYLPAGQPRLSIGIGIHGGQVVSGLIGSAQKREVTVIGDVVNTASRVEGLTKKLGASLIVTSEAISDDDRKRYLLRPLGRISPRGRRMGIDLFDVMGQRDRTARSREMEREIAQAGAALQKVAARDFETGAHELDVLASQVPAVRARGYDLLAAKVRELTKKPPPPEWTGEIALSD